MANINKSVNSSLNALNGNSFYINQVVLKIFSAIMIFFIGIIIGKIVETLLLRLFGEIELNKHFTRLFKAKWQYDKIIGKILEYAVFIISIIWALNVLEITKFIIVIIAALVAAALVLSLVFGLNDAVANIFAGIIIKLRSNMKVGDHIKASNVEGHIINMDLYHIRLETGKAESVFIPYTAILKTKFKKKHQ